jgi:hypothetical protein
MRGFIGESGSHTGSNRACGRYGGLCKTAYTGSIPVVASRF